MMNQNKLSLLRDILAFTLLFYAVIAGFFISVPESFIGETMRNIFYHVGMWAGMVVMFVISFVQSIKYLRINKIEFDLKARESAFTGLIFGFLGISTGMIWAHYTWGQFWVNDTKLNGAAIALLIYLAYFVLRQSVAEPNLKARISSVFNVFAFVLMIAFIIIIPRMGESIHPGNNSPTIMPSNLSPSIRMVFYPAMLGWILLSWSIFALRYRQAKLRHDLEILKSEISYDK